MFRLFCVSSIVACAFSAVHTHFDERIVGGQETTIEKYPYQVSFFKPNGSHFCGGSLINYKTVVTAAHCIQTIRDPSEIRVRLGSTNRFSGGIISEVFSIKEHEDYDFWTHQYDIAVITLSESVEYSESVQAIDFASVDPEIGSSAVVTGWGTLSEEGIQELPENLREVFVDIVSREYCQEAYKKYDIDSSMICAASVGKDACQGDSGGPLVANGKLLGVVSWGIGCARPEYPGIYANVPELRQWIERNIDWHKN
ncbi:alphaTry.2 family protein [Megaselia abdita]